MDIEILNVVKVVAPAAIAFFIGIAITPFVTGYLYRNKMWKKRAGKVSPDGKETPIFNELHKDKEVGTPKMGGVIIWGSVLITIVAMYFLANIFPTETTEKLNFLSRHQTWLPFFALIVGAVIGLVDDYLEITGKADYIAGGLSLKKRLLVVLLVSAIGAWWFFTKLDMTSILVPFMGELEIGWLFIPFFILVMLGLYSGGVIDGIDGLAIGLVGIALYVANRRNKN